LKVLFRKFIPYSISGILLVSILFASDITKLMNQFSHISFVSLLFIIALLFGNLLLVSLRLARALDKFQLKVPYRLSLQANTAGYVGGLLFWTLLGQTLGRQSILAKIGIKPSVVAMLTAYERIIIFIVSILFASLGALHLYNWDIVNDYISGWPLRDVFIVLIFSLALYFSMGSTHFEKIVFEKLQLKKLLSFIFEVGGLSALSLCLMFFTFIVAISNFIIDFNFIEVLCASAIISFVATLPISVNGWGVREIASIYVLGYFGLTMEQALAVSILVGACSSLIILMCAPYILKPKFIKGDYAQLDSKTISKVDDLEKVAIWLLGIAIASLIFFQIHFSLPNIGGVVNLNLADPFALFALTIVLQELLQKRKLPLWRTSSFNLSLLLLTLLLVFSFFYAIPSIGVTSWALGARLLGWFVILGYLSAGYLVVTHLGQQGLRRFYQNIAYTALVIVCLQIIVRLFFYYDIELGFFMVKNFEGYASNRNAFSFQLLIALLIFLVHTQRNKLVSSSIKNIKKFQFMLTVMMSVILLGIFLTESRAGVGTAVLIIFFTFVLGLNNKASVIQSILLSVVAYFCLLYLPPLVKGLLSGNIDSFFRNIDVFSGNMSLPSGIGSLETEKTRFNSDSERWVSISRGFQMWLENPIFGAGLGAFIEGSKLWADEPLVIHSTPIWILAEFGLVGALILFGIFIRLLLFAWNWQSGNPIRDILLLLLVSFAIFSTVHDIFYQRLFWLLIGSLLAIPMANNQSATVSNSVNSHEK
jgi:uncharacterized membrane protein YbhN (UPF0104 family)